MSRIRVAALATMLGVVVSANAEAQRYRFDLGLNGGYSYFTSMLTEDHTGLADNDVRYVNGALGGAQATFWLSPRLGLRANATYADRSIDSDDGTVTTLATDDLDHINLWSGTGDLMIRFAAPREEWTGTEFLPYLALGVGVKWQNPAGDRYSLVDNEEDKTWNGVPFMTGTGTSQRTFFVSELTTLMGLAGLGADVRLSPGFALRLEAGDRIWDPQLHEATAPTTGTTFTAAASDEDVGKTIHELYGQVGLHMLFGLQRRAEVAVVPAPPEPAPPVVTEPEPAPPVVRDEAITVCVIDPTAPGGIRMQSAFRVIESGDTVVDMNGMRRPLRDAIGTVTVARNADWYISGQPLTWTVGKDRIEFVSYGSARMIDSDDLTFIGTVNGLPVYAAREDVADVAMELNDLNRTRRGTDLTVFLNENATLRTELSDVRVYYVPLDPTGCVFQGVQRQEEVRKNGQQ